MVRGFVVTLVIVTVPLALVTTRMGATRRDAAVVLAAAVAGADAVVVVAAREIRKLPSGGFAASVGLGVAADVMAGLSADADTETVGAADVAVIVDGMVVVAAMAGVVGAVVTPRRLSGGFAATVGLGVSAELMAGLRITFVPPVVPAVVALTAGPAANWPGVAVVAAVVGVGDAEVVAFVPVTVAAAVVPVVPLVAGTVAGTKNAAPPPLVMTALPSGVLNDGLTVIS